MRDVRLPYGRRAWVFGSVSPAITLFGIVDRLDRAVAGELLEWALEHSKNPWVPLGTRALRRAYLASRPYYSTLDPQHTEGVSRLPSSSSGHVSAERSYPGLGALRRAADAVWQARQESLNTQIASDGEARKARVRTRASTYLTQLESQRRQSATRLASLRRMEGLRLSVRLAEVATGEPPIDYYPANWAREAGQIVADISPEVRAGLLLRIGPRRKGLWAALRRRLESFAEDQ